MRFWLPRGVDGGIGLSMLVQSCVDFLGQDAAMGPREDVRAVVVAVEILAMIGLGVVAVTVPDVMSIRTTLG